MARIQSAASDERVEAYAEEVRLYWLERAKLDRIQDHEARYTAGVELSRRHQERLASAGFTEEDADAYEARQYFESDRAAARREG